MDINTKIKEEIVGLIAKQKIVIKPEDLETPPTLEMGDLALPCFNLAKELKQSPVQIAKDLADKIKPSGLIIAVKSSGPYLNFVLDFNQVAALVIKQISKEKAKYGTSKIGKGEKVMIEYSQPNTHKEMHIGHMRTLLLGAALVNIYRSCGYKVISANYIGDTGAHVAKTLWYLQNYLNETDIPQDKRARGEFLGQSYTRAVAEITEHPELKEQAQEILKKIEDGDKALVKLWQETRQWSLDLFMAVYKELGVKFDVLFFESEEEVAGKKMMPQLLKYPFIKKSEGAIIADLSDYNLGVLVLLRKDGTALYGIKDLPLAIKKFKKYKVKKSLYVIDIRQSQYLQQVFKILQLIGFDKELIHVPYEFVQLKSGIISSRSGNVVTYEEVKEAALNKAIAETKARHADWSEEQINEVSFKIVSAALKFGILKSGNDKIITFDLAEALDVTGFTGPYLQYTLARINSIFKKSADRESKLKSPAVDYKNLATEIEKTLLKNLIQYPQIVKTVTQTNDPAALAQYLYNLAKDFNAFYHESPILKAEPAIMVARLELSLAVKQILSNGMNLLGLPLIEQM